MSYTGQPQTLKSALQGRVSVGQAQRLGSQRQNLGEGMMCPAGAGRIHHDQYMRSVSQNTLHLADAACSLYTEFSAARRIAIENSERPSLQVCTAGMNGSDPQGTGRNFIPEGIYDGSKRGAFVRHYSTRANRGEAEHPVQPYLYSSRPVQPWDGSHDAQQFLVRT